MAATGEAWSVGVFLFSVFCIVSWKFSLIGVSEVVTFTCRALLFLAFFTWISSFYPKLKSYLCPSTQPSEQGPAERAQNKLKQERARKEQQQQHSVKSDRYLKAVKPRQEAANRKKEEDIHVTRLSWKLSPGFSVGGKAARKRKELEVQNQALIQKQAPNGNKVITLPDEPSEDSYGVVEIALRCPSGRTFRRRFFKSCRSTVLLDWLHKSGYSPTLYALYTSYPRSPLPTRKDLSMEDVGIIAHTILHVEDKDPFFS